MVLPCWGVLSWVGPSWGGVLSWAGPSWGVGSILSWSFLGGSCPRMVLPQGSPVLGWSFLGGPVPGWPFLGGSCPGLALSGGGPVPGWPFLGGPVLGWSFLRGVLSWVLGEGFCPGLALPGGVLSWSVFSGGPVLVGLFWGSCPGGPFWRLPGSRLCDRLTLFCVAASFPTAPVMFGVGLHPSLRRVSPRPSQGTAGQGQGRTAGQGRGRTGGFWGKADSQPCLTFKALDSMSQDA